MPPLASLPHAAVHADYKAHIMLPNDQKHQEVCCCIFCLSIIPFVNFLTPLVVASVSAENYCTMKKFEEWRELPANQQGIAMQPTMPIQPVAAVPATHYARFA